jgi:hypothetical protein
MAHVELQTKISQVGIGPVIYIPSLNPMKRVPAVA